MLAGFAFVRLSIAEGKCILNAFLLGSKSGQIQLSIDIDRPDFKEQISYVWVLCQLQVRFVSCLKPVGNLSVLFIQTSLWLLDRAVLFHRMKCHEPRTLVLLCGFTAVAAFAVMEADMLASEEPKQPQETFLSTWKCLKYCRYDTLYFLATDIHNIYDIILQCILGTTTVRIALM